MNIRPSKSIYLGLIIIALLSCNIFSSQKPAAFTQTPATSAATEISLPALSITLDSTNESDGISLDTGGDVDTELVQVGSPAAEGRATGNGQTVSGGDSTPDNYLQLKVDDAKLSNGKPTSHVRIEVDYFDQGSDSFSLQYDGMASGGSDGLFAGGGSAVKTNTLTFKTAVFNLCDANFANRDNGADFRISDNGDGREVFRAVRVFGLPGSNSLVKVDDFGANPFDDQPDSEAVQSVLDSTCSGATIVFTSPAKDPNYKGYLMDKTLFLTGMSAKHDLTFTSSDPNDHAKLNATADLKGFVVRLYARSRFSDAGLIDNIDFGFVDINGGRDVRKCLGADEEINGKDDNWGSWLPECSEEGDPWCSPGNIGMDGGVDWNDGTQNYQGNPSSWTTGVNVHDLADAQGECGTALSFGSAKGAIQNVTIDTAGDHVHAAGCDYTDNDGDKTGWSDGITLFGPAHNITDNTIINPSDVGIVYFGGMNTIISNNTVRITSGNYGAFAGIAIHSWAFGDSSGDQIIGNHVTSEGDTKCGSLHAGINIGPHMWYACVSTSTSAMFGNNTCSQRPKESRVTTCNGGTCQIWTYLPEGSTLTMRDNFVSGAQINYLIDGFDNLGTFIDENNVSQGPRLADWDAAKVGCEGVTWGALDKVAHDPSLAGYTDLIIHCTR